MDLAEWHVYHRNLVTDKLFISIETAAKLLLRLDDHAISIINSMTLSPSPGLILIGIRTRVEFGQGQAEQNGPFLSHYHGHCRQQLPLGLLTPATAALE